VYEYANYTVCVHVWNGVQLNVGNESENRGTPPFVTNVGKTWRQNPVRNVSAPVIALPMMFPQRSNPANTSMAPGRSGADIFRKPGGQLELQSPSLVLSGCGGILQAISPYFSYSFFVLILWRRLSEVEK
jgi:hypothetical protein